MSQSQAYRIAVIGAGMAGLACAGALQRAGHAVTLFDKSRRVGGRLATRRVDGLIFDHGAQYATARDPAFIAVMQAMAAAGNAAPWAAAGKERWCGVPGMSTLAQYMGRQGVGFLQTGRHVAFLHREAEGWLVRHRDAAQTRPSVVSDQGGELAGPFDQVAVALPSPQAAGLLQPHAFAAEAASAGMAPCWAMMLAFTEATAAPDLLRPDTGPLRWIARDSSRPGRVPLPECWIAHATPEWSRSHLEQPADAVQATLLDVFMAATGITAIPSYAAMHRWRYALADAPLNQPALWDATAGIGGCGDWCLGARVEAAFMSGRALADMMTG